MRTQRPSLHLVQTPLGVPRPYTHLLALLCAVPSGTKRGPRHHDRRGQPNRRAPRTRWKCAQRERRPPGRGEKTPCVSPKRATVTQRGAAEGRPPDTQSRSHAHGVPARLPPARGGGVGGRPRRPCLASRLPSPRHGEPGAAAETRCTAQRCPQPLPTRRQRWGLGDLPPFPHPRGRAR